MSADEEDEEPTVILGLTADKLAGISTGIFVFILLLITLLLIIIVALTLRKRKLGGGRKGMLQHYMWTFSSILVVEYSSKFRLYIQDKWLIIIVHVYTWCYNNIVSNLSHTQHFTGLFRSRSRQSKSSHSSEMRIFHAARWHHHTETQFCLLAYIRLFTF